MPTTNNTLIKLEQKHNVQWRDFRIGDLFSIQTTKKKFNAVNLDFNGKHRYVARGDKNNGIRGYINEDAHYLNPAHTISFGQDTATVFYQDQPYFTGDKIKIFVPLQGVKLNRYTSSIFISSMRKIFSYFTWGSSSYNVTILKNIKIKLPVTSRGDLHYDFMKEFIETLEAERIAALEAYLSQRI